jgi:hypothetical protein
MFNSMVTVRNIQSTGGIQRLLQLGTHRSKKKKKATLEF